MAIGKSFAALGLALALGVDSGYRSSERVCAQRALV
jgi:hypothetical protein